MVEVGFLDLLLGIRLLKEKSYGGSGKCIERLFLDIVDQLWGIKVESSKMGVLEVSEGVISKQNRRERGSWSLCSQGICFILFRVGGGQSKENWKREEQGNLRCRGFLDLIFEEDQEFLGNDELLVLVDFIVDM